MKCLGAAANAAAPRHLVNPARNDLLRDLLKLVVVSVVLLVVI